MVGLRLQAIDRPVGERVDKRIGESQGSMTREVMWRFRWGVIHPHGMLRPSGGERQRAKGLPSTAKVDAYHTVTQEQDEPKHRNVYHNQRVRSSDGRQA